MSLPEIIHTFLDVAVCRRHETFSFKMSLLAMSFEISSVWALCQWPAFRLALSGLFVLSCAQMGWENSMIMSGLTFRKTLAGTGWAVSLLCTKWVEKLYNPYLWLAHSAQWRD